ncbi:MAG: arginine decarboxylase [Chloroflexota bacterium]
MSHPVIGWEQETPIPNHPFTGFLEARQGRLYLEGLDLAQLLLGDRQDQGAGRTFSSPLEIVYLPLIRKKIRALQQAFADAIAEIGYPGQFIYTYPSKVNMAEEVVQTVARTGVNYEISTVMDVAIVRRLLETGSLTRRQKVLCNGFKPAGTGYADAIVQLQRDYGNIFPVVDDLSELPPLLESGLAFEVGLRQKSYGHHTNAAEMEAANSRFGMTTDDLWQAAERIAASENLTLTMYHAMVGSQIANGEDFVARLTPPIELYARLRRRHPGLNVFNFGGGVPAQMTLDFDFDYRAFARRLLDTLAQVCARFQVPPPDVMGEMGRYTVSEHGAHLFKVVEVKENRSTYPWYIINGSIMSSFPDTWALGEHFIVLPVTHLDQPFRRVQLGGITCDSDDIYPQHKSTAPLYLPVETRDLYVGFFSIGAYQEILGGIGGVKHCVVPEAEELIVDQNLDGTYRFRAVPGQDAARLLANLGFRL